MILVFMGPPGCGKGTQAQILEKKLKYKIFSAGDLLRQEISDGSEIGQKIKDIIETGDYVPDMLIFDLIRKNVAPYMDQNIVIDGFPRTLGQAELMEGWLKNTEVKIIYFDVSYSALLERIVNRVSCGSCGAIYNLKTNPPKTVDVCDACGHKGFTRRHDDEEQVLKRRLENDTKQSGPVVAFFDARGLLYKVDASKDMSTVTAQMLEIVSK